MTSIDHETDLRSWWIAWWWLAGTHTAGNNGQSELEQKNVRRNCTSSDETTWAGTTLGTIEYGGDTFCARVYQDAVEKPCGD
ncbi:hypothetical protein [Salinifilum aidingensis]